MRTSVSAVMVYHHYYIDLENLDDSMQPLSVPEVVSVEQ